MRPRYRLSGVEFKDSMAKELMHKGGHPFGEASAEEDEHVLVVLAQLILFPCLFHNGAGSQGNQGRLDSLNLGGPLQ